MSGDGLAPEEQSRADLYALLARLFYAPPDKELLEAIGHAAALGGAASAPLAQAWGRLQEAALAADADAVREEYEALFGGTGKAQVTLYTSAYTMKTMIDQPLVEIRDFLDRNGLRRLDAVHVPEDHLAALCEVMRHLVLGANSAAQHEFFDRFMWPSGIPLCDAIEGSQDANFYRHAAQFARSFAELEHELRER